MILNVIKCGHPTLREKGKRVERVTPEVRQLAGDMIETMYAANGVGLAAQQVGRTLMLAVIDIRNSEQPSELWRDNQQQDIPSQMPLVLLNPRITASEGEQTGEEGCLSVPEISAAIRRAARVRVEAQDLDGQPFCIEATGLLARAIQHELDHLNGILFLDRMDAATRASFEGKIKKLQKQTRAALKAKQ
ncbi:MAG: peptide deformylase [Verrucomicrobia bacterium]|nr:peptide deformylase [Verrucomicrobiota bacterium]